MQRGILGFAAEGVLRLEVRLALSARAPAPSGDAVPEAVLPRGELGLALIALLLLSPALGGRLHALAVERGDEAVELGVLDLARGV